MLRRLLIVVVLAAAAAALAWALWPKPVSVETAVIETRSIAVTVAEEGKARIREVFTVSAPIAGEMQRLGLHAGDAVVGGETVVASIRPVAPSLLDARARRVAEAAVKAARAAVDLAAAELRQAEAQLIFLKSELDRATRLVERGTISERAFEKAKLDVETGVASVESARAGLAVRERELESAEAALMVTDDTAIACCTDVKAPVSGRILKVMAESQQVVQAGTPLVAIGDPADLEIVTDLLSRDAVRIAVGNGAEITNWGGPPLTARVSRIDPQAATKVSALGIEEQRVPVVLKLEGDPARWASLGHDYRVVADISVWQGDNLVAAPIGALFRDQGNWSVYVVRDGAAELRKVEIGQRNDDYAEVVSGLAAGDAVVLHPSDKVSDGVKVLAASAD